MQLNVCYRFYLKERIKAKIMIVSDLMAAVLLQRVKESRFQVQETDEVDLWDRTRIVSTEPAPKPAPGPVQEREKTFLYRIFSRFGFNREVENRSAC